MSNMRSFQRLDYDQFELKQTEQEVEHVHQFILVGLYMTSLVCADRQQLVASQRQFADISY